MLIKKVSEADTRCRFVSPRGTLCTVHKSRYISPNKLGRLMRTSPGCRTENFGHRGIFSTGFDSDQEGSERSDSAV